MKFSGRAFGRVWKHERELYLLFDKRWGQSPALDLLKGPKWPPCLALHMSQGIWHILFTASQPLWARAVLWPPTSALGQGEPQRPSAMQDCATAPSLAHNCMWSRKGETSFQNLLKQCGHMDAKVPLLLPLNLPQTLKREQCPKNLLGRRKYQAQVSNKPGLMDMDSGGKQHTHFLEHEMGFLLSLK